MLIAERLRQERKSHNLTQQEVSEFLNIGRAAYALYETGKNKPTIESILALAKLYNCSTDFLLGRYDK